MSDTVFLFIVGLSLGAFLALVSLFRKDLAMNIVGGILTLHILGSIICGIWASFECMGHHTDEYERGSLCYIYLMGELPYFDFVMPIIVIIGSGISYFVVRKICGR